ncbi:hypothetical protein KSS87_002686 [Heliosperma pusillum]|nr:hypothetical protein KSS87_002686 [Heliosperma pusillum]
MLFRIKGQNCHLLVHAFINRIFLKCAIRYILILCFFICHSHCSRHFLLSSISLKI